MGTRRTGRSGGTRGTGVPACRHSEMNRSAASIASRNSTPRPGRCCSYQTTAASSSAEASASISMVRVTAEQGDVQRVSVLHPMAHPQIHPTRHAAPFSRSLSPTQLQQFRDHPLAHRDSRSIPRLRRRAHRPATSGLRVGALALAGSCNHCSPGYPGPTNEQAA